jgi:hypothetical protein
VVEVRSKCGDRLGEGTAMKRIPLVYSRAVMVGAAGSGKLSLLTGQHDDPSFGYAW